MRIWSAGAKTITLPNSKKTKELILHDSRLHEKETREPPPPQYRWREGRGGQELPISQGSYQSRSVIEQEHINSGKKRTSEAPIPAEPKEIMATTTAAGELLQVHHGVKDHILHHSGCTLENREIL